MPEAPSPADRASLARQRAALAAAAHDDDGSPEWRRAVREWADEHRVADGRPRLDEWWRTKTEPELHRRARARGLVD